ncbi:MAG: 50S ribosomal protein L23 [Oceanococcaceae bacterium]
MLTAEKALTVLRAPLVTEKSSRLAETDNVVTFAVARDATKPQIRRAVESLFKVSVQSVTTVCVKGKSKRFGRSMGRRSDWKKAYVRLADGQTIDFTAGIGA